MSFWDEKETKSKYNNFKHLSQEFSGNLLELVKQKGVYPLYPYEYMTSFKKFFDKLALPFKIYDDSKFVFKDECISEKKIFLNINNIVYGITMGDLSWSQIYDHFLWSSSLFSFVISSTLNIFVCYKNGIKVI